MGINLPYGKDKTVILDAPDKNISLLIGGSAAIRETSRRNQKIFTSLSLKV